MEFRTDSFQSRFRLASGCRQAEFPIFDVVAATVPFVGPGKKKQAAATGVECRSCLPLQHERLPRFPMTQTVQANFPHH